MRKIQAQGVHHITIVGADRQTSIGFWEGLLGMPFVFEQPNLDNPGESHLYFDPGDGRLITVFTHEERVADPARVSTEPGCVHHLAFALSQATFAQVVERLDERGISHSGVKDGASWTRSTSRTPLGLLIELASYRFEPPVGFMLAEVLLEAPGSASSGATITSTRCISRTRSRGSSSAPAPRCGRPATRYS